MVVVCLPISVLTPKFQFLFSRLRISVRPHFLLAVFALLSGAAICSGQDIPFAGIGGEEGEKRLDSFWKTSDARLALEAGLDDVAFQTAVDALEFESDEAKRRELNLVAVDALLAANRPDEVDAWLMRAFSDEDSPEIRLRRALVAFARNEREVVRLALENVPAAVFEAGSLAWFNVMQGWLAIGEGDVEEAQAKWLAAQEVANELSPALAAQIAYLIYRYELLNRESEQVDFEALQADFEREEGTEIGYRYAQQMAAILAERGDRIAATTLIESQLATLPEEFAALRDEFHLLLAVNSNLDGESGRGAARSLIIDGSAERLMRICLQHVFTIALDASDERKTFLVEVLDEISLLGSGHPLIDEALYYRSFIGFLNGQYDEVEADADRLLTEFRGSAYNKGALALLASSAWQNSRFRIAAGLLRQLRDEYASDAEKSELRAFIGDCYFRAGAQSRLADDFVSAADAYSSALDEVENPIAAGPLFFQLVLSNLRAGNIPQALAVLDDDAIRAKADSLNVWRAEWMALKAMRSIQVAGAAYERAQLSVGQGNLDTNLQARFLWLLAKLSIESGQPDETSVWVERLDSLLTQAPEGSFDEAFVSEVRSSSRLALADALQKLGQPDEAIKIWEGLRLEFPGQDAALLSYLNQARYLSSQNSTVEAQNLLVSLADEYRDSRYAPVALYEAAINAERRGQDAFLTQALQLLERIAQDYSDSEVVYYARLKQADLSRKLNLFGAAQQIYELLENTYRDHDDRHLAQLNLATTLRAQAAEDPSKFDAAINRFELLVDLPNVPSHVRVEAGYQLGVAWEGLNEVVKAKRVYFSLQEMILREDPQLELLKAEGRYWLSRTLFKLAELLEKDGDIEKANTFYQKIIDLGLIGMETAKARMGISVGSGN